ncbi:hypothetical protein FHS26_005255 [Rhizobium pisi]|uniref:Uncharacterized protein n=1 Tax=Rhizobium pisi TaxID=574561 RepID=A0A7W5G1S4_9HYPH|nr:hypothetical protein [Rhizobium pisi]
MIPSTVRHDGLDMRLMFDLDPHVSISETDVGSSIF